MFYKVTIKLLSVHDIIVIPFTTGQESTALTTADDESDDEVVPEVIKASTMDDDESRKESTSQSLKQGKLHF